MSGSKSPKPSGSSGSDDSSDSRSSTPPQLSDEAQGPPNPPVLIPPARPRNTSSEAPLLNPQSPMRSVSSSFVSSPLNPNGNTTHSFRSRPPSSLSIYNRMASEDATALSASQSGPRGSMILYRLATEDDNGALAPPRSTIYRPDSVVSTSDQSIFSLSSDSKYPSGHMKTRGLVPYAYDPETDFVTEEDDFLHEPDSNSSNTPNLFTGRGLLNIGALLLLILALLSLFICYPVVSYTQLNYRNKQLASNAQLNTDGNPFITPSASFKVPSLIDSDTPASVQQRTGFDGNQYTLVFSDEFTQDGRSFYPGDDPYWEAVNLWYWATKDEEWYDPAQITTKGGALQITIDQSSDHPGLLYKSGMLQSWNKFCFSSGYIEVAVTFPGPNSNTQGYWPGVWTMGNLGRPGYGATTDGLWPYSYNECDVGTFPNQTLADHSGPPAALHSNASKSTYNYELSWLPGQRLSACTCPGEDHPGPSPSKGRGAPEIDIFEAERNKTGGIGGVVSQSAQFAPFTADYNYLNNTPDEFSIFDSSVTRPNNYRGSAVQQAVSALTNLPDNSFEGGGQVFTKLGFEYWANPSNPSEGYITWMTNGAQTMRMSQAAVGPDQGPTGSGVGQRLIPEEPMSIVMNLGVSPGWQTVDPTTMQFPAVMLIDYIRVYQRSSSTNIGCSPDGYPTADYIKRHPEAYGNPNVTAWGAVPGGAGNKWPRNSLYSGGC